jgi:chromatin segregation and condensation protein Rec8/ScpA/Scc1 (kleisin family)
MSSEQETLDELKAYRDKVYDEVVRRAELVKRMATEVAAADFLVGGAGRAASPPHVTATELQRREATKAAMKRRHAELVSKHRQALDDLRSAEQRLVEVDGQIRTTESGGDVSGMIAGDE